VEYGSGFGFCRHRRFSGLNGGGSEESHAIPLGLVESTTTRERSLTRECGWHTVSCKYLS